jgi:hypothetical protein
MSRELVRWIAVSATIWVTACSYTPPEGPGPDGPALPTVEFRESVSLTDERVTMLVIPVELSEPSTSSVDFRVTGGIAIANTDFVLAGGGGTTGTLTFSGKTQNLEIMIVDDGMEEADETIVIELENPEGATLGTKTTHTVTISADILPRVKFTNLVTQADEDLPAGAKLDLELDVASTAEVSIDVVIAAASTAASNDFGLTTRTVTFAAGVTTVQLDYEIVADTRDENNDVIGVDLANPIGVVVDTTSAHTDHTILDDDDPPTVFFTNATNTQNEAVPDADQIVQLSGPSDKMISVQYAASGDAAGAADLTVGGNGTLTFAPGVTTQEIPLTIEDDLLDEGINETATITLSNPTNAALGTPSTHVLTITDDEDPPQVRFGAPASDATEGTTATAKVAVTLSAPSALTVTVAFTVDGSSTAADPGDYTIANPTRTLTFAPGDISEDIDLTFVDNTTGETDETIVLGLATPTNATLGTPVTHTVTITDDDCLGSGDFRVCLNAAPVNNRNLSGNFNTNAGNALCASGAAVPIGWTTTFGQPDACFVIANQLAITGTLNVTGTRPLVLVGVNTLTVNNNIDASANGTVDGPAGPSALCGAPTAAENHVDGGGGGAGGSFMSKGGNGGDGDASDNQADGGNSPNADAADPTVLRAGCAGQQGGTGPGAGGEGGGAGGAVYLIGNAITIGARIDVSGAGGLGGASDAGAGGGAGSGGMIVIDGLVSLTFTGTLMANGGGAGQGADTNTPGDDGLSPTAAATVATGGQTADAGGNGGNGFVTGTQATSGNDGLANQGAGGGGGGGGFIRSTRSLAGGTTSAGKIVAP